MSKHKLPVQSLDTEAPITAESEGATAASFTTLFTFDAASDSDAYHAVEAVKHMVQLGKNAFIVDSSVVIA